MKRQSLFAWILSLALLLAPMSGAAQTPAEGTGPIREAAAAPSDGAGRAVTSSAIPATDHEWWATVQDEIRQSEYNVTWQAQTYLSDLRAAYQAPNRMQNLRTYFTRQGIRIIPRVFVGETPPWQWGLHLSGYGSARGMQWVSPPVRLVVEDNRIEYVYNDLTEWYVNSEQGLEQGFTLRTPPPLANAGPPGEIVLDLTLSGDLTPHLSADGSAVELTTAGGVRVLRYGNLAVMDAGQRALPAHLEIAAHNDTGRLTGTAWPGLAGRSAAVIRLVIDAVGARYPITVDPLAAGVAWTAESDQAGANFGWSVGTAGDVNGDGYSDVIVGAYYFDGGQADEGRATVYHGSAAGLSASPAWTAESDQTGAEFGFAVGTAGDVNGDTYSDVIVGAHWYDNDQVDEGRAFVYHGSAAGLSAGPTWTAESDQTGAKFGQAVATAGDVNGDGYSDVMVGATQYDNGATDEGRAYVYHGSAAGLSAGAAWTAESDQADAGFGAAVGTAGDVNGDGYGDVIAGARTYDNGQTDEGRAYVYQGSPAGLSTNAAWTAEGDQAGAWFGRSVGTAGDVNSDGFSEVIVGAFTYDNGQVDEGRAFVFHGAAGGLGTSASWMAESGQANARFGESVGTAGDVNGDGYGDIIVGAPGGHNGQVDEGLAYVYYGTDGGLGADAAWTGESDEAGARFGCSAGTAGDVNGDGYSDIIAGAHWYDNGQTDEGRAYVFHGGAGGPSATAAWTGESDQPFAWAGWSVGTAGDVNGDGYSDVIVGAPGYDDGQTSGGRVFVYHGAAGGLSATAAWVAQRDLPGAYFGYAVGTAGDVNGDGYSDVVIGARYDANGQEGEGRAYVYHGAAGGLSTSAAWTAESDQAYADFGFAVGTAGDVNGDGYSDVIVGAPGYNNGETDEGRAFVYHGGTAGLGASAAWTAESDQSDAQLGSAVGTAGDVNGDGFSDVIVGVVRYDNGQTDEGRAYVYHGAANGLGASAAWATESDQDLAFLGVAVGTAGDVNSDGFSDVIVGAALYDSSLTDAGRAYVFSGAAGGLPVSAVWIGEGDQVGAWFGRSVGTAGDVNGDGYSDIVVGAPYYDNGQTDEGRAYVYHGAASGLDSSPAWTAESDMANTWFGVAAGRAGDVNGDGFSDVIVGAPYFGSGQSDEGRTYVFVGNGGSGLPVLARQMRSDGSAPIAQLGSSDARTAFQLRMVGRMPLGRFQVRMQWQVAPVGVSFSSPSAISGVSPWTDVGTTGVVISQDVTGLTLGTPYHWRARLLYAPGNALGLRAGRWVHIPWNSSSEQDLRTAHNQPPVANAGPDQGVELSELVTLDGSDSSDFDGDLPLTYAWTQTGGPPVTLSDPSSVAPTFTTPADPTILTFILLVVDSQGLKSAVQDTVVVAVATVGGESASFTYLPAVRR